MKALAVDNKKPGNTDDVLVGKKNKRLMESRPPTFSWAGFVLKFFDFIV